MTGYWNGGWLGPERTGAGPRRAASGHQAGIGKQGSGCEANGVSAPMVTFVVTALSVSVSVPMGLPPPLLPEVHVV
ncbi:hypothetical protein GCM10009608_11910 [Pseudonocardia alaniniphila]